MKPVISSLQRVSIPTYPLGKPDRNPVFFEKRVYQGSKGSVYPVPFIDKVYDKPAPQDYLLGTIENEFIYLEVLPEIGGRIFKGQDKTNNNYDFIYRQDVIKPALVGLAGPWISGGVEFNWPQHHRPGTYLPSDIFIEKEADGAHTIWMTEIDAISRMRGMTGLCVRPGSSLVELKVRLINRTPVTQTFLWWANLAAKVHDRYQSFFPPDVHYVADHAVRAMSSFPIADGHYYGVDYSARPNANDLSWYRNIPVPTSYMICETQGGFLGGFDYEAGGGFLHIANRHISPGKKQWTWGNHEFGWAWDRELTDEGGPYVELMSGVYTDNQPDFSYLAPYETKTFSQYWWPIQHVGPVQEANCEAAIRLVVAEDRSIEFSVLCSQPHDRLEIRLFEGDRSLLNHTGVKIQPGQPWKASGLTLIGDKANALRAEVRDETGHLLIVCRGYEPPEVPVRSRSIAKVMPEAEVLEREDDLILAGEHLEQNRHPTRDSRPYWEKVLSSDSGNYRANLALGKVSLNDGDLHAAKQYFAAARTRLTLHHPNPSSGEAWYFGGICARYLGDVDEAYPLFYKATWNYEWRSPSYYELACLDMRAGRFKEAGEHARLSLETNQLNNKATIVQALALDKMGKANEAQILLEQLQKSDGLDAWAYYELTRIQKRDLESFRQRFRNDAQTILEIAFEYATCGLWERGIELLLWHVDTRVVPVAVPNPGERSPLVPFVLAWMYFQSQQNDLADEWLTTGNLTEPEYAFPSRIEEMIVLEWARSRRNSDIIGFALGNYYFSKRRHSSAIVCWEEAVETGTRNPTVFRNLGIAYWNSGRMSDKARSAYLRALELDPMDARLVYEYDQLRKKMGDAESERLSLLTRKWALVESRDDACIEWAALMNNACKHSEVLMLLMNRRFHPWEGGEGRVLRQFTDAKIGLGKQALARGETEQALELFESAFDSPDNLGEANHLLQAKADANYWRGKALRALEREEEATHAFEASVSERFDFLGMEVVPFSPISYYKGMALIELGQTAEAEAFFKSMMAYVDEERSKPARIDYFATSLPNLLVFDEDLDQARARELDALEDLANRGLDACQSHASANT